MNVKKNFEKVKNYVGKHKKEIAIGLVVIVGGVAVYKIAKIKPKYVQEFDELVALKETDGTKIDTKKVDWLLAWKEPDRIKIDIPEKLSGMVEEISGPDTGEWYDLWIDTVKLSDLGKLGEELCKIDGFGPDSVVRGGVNSLIPNVEYLNK